MKNLRAIVLLFVANTVSGVAQGISMLAIPWYFARDGDMARFGLIYILTNLVSLFWVPYAGVLIDKFSRKRVFIVISLVGGLAVGAIAWLGHWQGDLPWWLVALVFGLTFFNYNIHYPNLYAFVQEITEPRSYGKITSALEIQGQITTMAAGAAGAVLLEGTQNGMLNVFGFLVKVPWDIPAWRIHEIFTLDAATYFVGFLIILAIRYQPLKQRHVEHGRLLVRLNIGWQYLRNHKLIFIFGVASYSIFVTILIGVFYLDPLYVSNHLHETGDVFAASEMYYAIGAVFAGVAILRMFTRWNGVIGIILLTVITAFIFGWLAVAHSVIVYYIVVLLMGLTNAGTRILRVNYLFNTVPNQVYGRANSIFNMTNILLRIAFLALFSLPFFHVGNNVIYAFVILGIFLLVAAGVLIAYYRNFVAILATQRT
ncbi:MAG: MFS transporter [Saprospiraceae bacterium]|nr:MFS transporter [Saprospiraceae bacterium]